MLSILLLGPPKILRNGAPVELPRRRARALVYYLATQPGAVGREQIIALLWPDHERQAAQQLLRTTLHTARKALGPALLSGEDQLAISSDAHVDVRALAAAQVSSDPLSLAAALDSYRGDLLAGFCLGDSVPFEEWLAAERERVQSLAVRGMTRLSRIYEAHHDYPAALAALTRALAFDPLQEDLQRAAMRLHYLAGDRVGAIRRYEVLRDLLDTEMGVPPMAETQALYDAVIKDEVRRMQDAGDPPAPTAISAARTRLSASVAPHAPSCIAHPLALPFTGRSTELTRIQLAADSGWLALIEGEPGIGKTRLAEEFLARRGGLALVGEARELEQSMPYQPVVAALRGLVARPDWPALRDRLAIDPLWLREAARLLPELISAPDGLPPADESRLWEALARLLAALARVTPLALLIDDLQWADATTLGLLGYLLRRVVGAPMAILATVRPPDPRSPLGGLIGALLREGRVERLSLSRLGHADTLALAQSLSPRYAQPLAIWLDRSAEGNPYIISELVGHARSSGLLIADGTLNLSALPASPVLPQTVYSLIQSRLIRLSEGARRVLDAAVAVGREFEFDVAARAAALSEEAALDALDELRAARMVRPLDDGRFTFDHSLTMEVAYREMGKPRHQLLHRRVGEVLESLYRDRLDSQAGLIASHFAEGGAPERAATYAVRAGRRAALVAAWAQAAAFYEQALAGTPASGRPALLLALGEALHNAGEIARAAERLREALDSSRTQADAHAARLALARTILAQGRYAEMIDLVRPLHGSPLPGEAVAALFLWGTALSLEGADLGGAAERLRAAEALIAQPPAAADRRALAQVRFELGSVMAQQGDLIQAIAYYREAIAVADSDAAAATSADPWRILARNNLAYHLHLLGDLDAADRHIADAMAMAEDRGAIALQPYLFSTAGEIALARGDLGAAERLFGTGMAIAERLHIPERIAGLGANLGLVALRREQQSLAIHRLSTALARADALGTRHLAAQIRVWLAPLLPPAEARAALAEARTIAESGGRTRILAQIERLEQRPPGAEAPGEVDDGR